jgi:ABC-type glycerol-3-phosphate transport system substrate-binding protein
MALGWVRDRLIGRATPQGALNYAEPESLALFAQGHAVFLRNWPYAWRICQNPVKSRVAGRVGVTLLPHFAGGESASTLGGWQWGVNRYSRHPEAAWRFVRFMTSAPAQKALVLGAGRSPTRRAVYHDPEVLARLPHLAEFLPAFEAARPRPASPLYPMVSQELQRLFSKAIVRPDSDLAALTKTGADRLAAIEALVREAAP